MKRRSEISIYIYDGVRGAMLYTDARVVYGKGEVWWRFEISGNVFFFLPSFLVC